MSIIHLARADFSALSSDAQAVICKMVAAIENQVLPDDAWRSAAVADSLQQFGAGMLLDIADDGLANTNISVLLDGLTVAKVRGYCLYQAVFETAEIHRIGTAPNYLRQGVAVGLIGALQGVCRSVDAEQILLEVRADNAPAIGLYQHVGFGQIDQRAGYYKTDNGAVDALILRLVL